MRFIGYGMENATCVPSPTAKLLTCEEFLQELCVDDADLAAIQHYEQKSAPWLRARRGRLTASNFGAAVGHNKYQKPRALVKQLLWREFRGNANTQWGVDHEPVALAAYRQLMEVHLQEQQACENQFVANKDLLSVAQEWEWAESCLYEPATMLSCEVEETGLCVRKPRFWMGNSPDGLVHVKYTNGDVETGLLEIKCPASCKLYASETAPSGIPLHYMDQIQGTMGNLGLPWCDFVVWTPKAMSVVRVPFSQAYWTLFLLPSLTRFYFGLYLPAAVKQRNLLLKEGDV